MDSVDLKTIKCPDCFSPMRKLYSRKELQDSLNEMEFINRLHRGNVEFDLGRQIICTSQKCSLIKKMDYIQIVRESRAWKT